MLHLGHSIFGLVILKELMPVTLKQNIRNPKMFCILTSTDQNRSKCLGRTRDVALPRSFRRRPAGDSTSAWFPRRAVSHDTGLSQG